MPKQSRGCWCPVEHHSKSVFNLVILLDIVAILLLLYITVMDGNNWIFYMPTLILLAGSMLILFDKYRS